MQQIRQGSCYCKCKDSLSTPCFPVSASHFKARHQMSIIDIVMLSTFQVCQSPRCPGGTTVTTTGRVREVFVKDTKCPLTSYLLDRQRRRSGQGATLAHLITHPPVLLLILADGGVVHHGEMRILASSQTRENVLGEKKRHEQQ